MSGENLYLYAWQVQEPDGQWSMVGALVPETGSHMPLVHRSLQVIEHLRPLATDHAAATRQKLRLARYGLAQVLETRDYSKKA
jgi:hypothetical protein